MTNKISLFVENKENNKDIKYFFEENNIDFEIINNFESKDNNNFKEKLIHKDKFDTKTIISGDWIIYININEFTKNPYFYLIEKLIIPLMRDYQKFDLANILIKKLLIKKDLISNISKDSFEKVLTNNIIYLLLENRLDEAIDNYLILRKNEGFNLLEFKNHSKENSKYIQKTIELLEELKTSKYILINIDKVNKYINSLNLKLDSRKKITSKAIDKLKSNIQILNNKLSICIISLTDNPENIDNTVKSVLSIAHEILIFVIGSCGNIKNQYSQYAKIFEYNNNKNILDIKNSFFEQANGDWLLFINPNEELKYESQTSIISFLEKQNKSDQLIFNLKILQKRDNIYLKSNLQKRLFKGKSKVKFLDPINEILDIDESVKVINNPEISIIENLFNSNDNGINNDINIIENYIKDNSENTNNYIYFNYLGEKYSSLNQSSIALDRFITSYNLYNKNNTNKINRYYGNILFNLINEYLFYQKNTKESYKYIIEFARLFQGFLTSYLFLGYKNQLIFDYKNAIEIYNYILNLNNNSQNNNTLQINSFDNLENIIYFEIGRCYINTGYDLLGIKYFEDLYKKNPLDKYLNFHLAKYFLLENNLEKAGKYIFFKDKNKSDVEWIEKISKLDPETLVCREETIRHLNFLINEGNWSEDELESMKNKILQLNY